jgi:hypothetical protein
LGDIKWLGQRASPLREAGTVVESRKLPIVKGNHMTARKETQIIIKLPPESAFRMAEEILLLIGAKIKSKASGTISARKRMSILSWGEDITIAISPTSTDSSVLDIKSESALKTTLLDYGANAGNVDKIVKAFQNNGVAVVNS